MSTLMKKTEKQSENSLEAVFALEVDPARVSNSLYLTLHGIICSSA